MFKKNLFSVVVRMAVLVAIIFSVGIVSRVVGAVGMNVPDLGLPNIPAILPVLTFSASSVREGETTVVTATLTKAVASNTTINFGYGGLATRNVDYTFGAPIVIPAGKLVGTANFRALPDEFADDGEAAILTANPIAGISIPSALNVVIKNRPTLRLQWVISSVGEGGSVNIEASVVGGTLSNPLTVPVQIGGTAINNTDYALGVITIPTIRIFGLGLLNALSDIAVEGNETVDLTIAGDFLATPGEAFDGVNVIYPQGKPARATITDVIANGTLNIFTTITNNDGGTKGVADASITLSSAVASKILLVNGSGVVIAGGAYPATSVTFPGVANRSIIVKGETGISISAGAMAGYTVSVSCVGGGVPLFPFTITAGVNERCTVAYDDVNAAAAPKITVVNNIVGGDATAGNFTLKVGSAVVANSIENTVTAGTYNVTATTAKPNYTSTFSGGCNASGVITLVNGDVKTCTITSTYTPVLPTEIDFTIDKTEVVRGGYFSVTASWPEGVVAQASDQQFDVSFSGATRNDDYNVYFVPTVDTAAPAKMVMPKNKTSALTMIVTIPYKVAEDETVGITISGETKTVKLVNLGDGDCNSEIFGMTSKVTASQVDHGITNFDSHVDAAPGNSVLAELGIITPGKGYAPNKEQAACVAKPDPDDTYGLRGYAWNDNLGFLSLYCNGENGNDGENLGIGCGEYSYGVTVGRKGHGGSDTQRLLTGFAWNSAFGYISFSDNQRVPLYKVIATQRANSSTYWDLSGYAWTQAGVYLNMRGVTIELLPMAADECTERTAGYPCCLPNGYEFEMCGPYYDYEINSCGDYGELCFLDDDQIEHDLTKTIATICSDDLKDNGKLDDAGCCTVYPQAPLASGGTCSSNPPNCKPPFFTEEGVCILPVPDSDLISSVNLGSLPVANCTDGYSLDLYIAGKDGVPRDYDKDIIHLVFSWADTVKLNQIDPALIAGPISGLSSPWAAKKGGVNYKPITIDVTYNPITGSNFDTLFDQVEKGHYRLKKKVTSCAPTSGGNVSPVKTMAEAMFDNEMFLGMKTLLNWDESESNNLALRSVDSFVIDKKGNLVSAGNISPDEEPVYLRFRPAVEISSLVTSDLVDAITANRDIPFTVKMDIKNGLVGAVNAVNLILAYDSTGKAVDPSCTSAPFTMKISGNGNAGVNECSSAKLKNGSCKLTYNNVVNGTKTIEVTPKLPEVDGQPVAICPKMVAPAIYSTIEYTKTDGGVTNLVKYYSNKLPKIDGSFLDNTAAIIHGTILSTMQFSTDVTQTYSPAGDVVSNVVRDAVHRNVAEYVKNADAAKALVNGGTFEIADDNRCIITRIARDGDSSM
ncbi:MAG: hypothetical protein WCX95_04280, partial [Candidatus Gracilibacteria bacterium]